METIEKVNEGKVIITNLNPKKIKVKTKYDFKYGIFRIEVKLKDKKE